MKIHKIGGNRHSKRLEQERALWKRHIAPLTPAQLDECSKHYAATLDEEIARQANDGTLDDTIRAATAPTHGMDTFGLRG